MEVWKKYKKDLTAEGYRPTSRLQHCRSSEIILSNVYVRIQEAVT